ncbi:winged helix-turn-helix transcriptional regulator [Dongia sp.]|uniref:winged helix-turn-helix transcriptional regulator n=1 Tax=Dongia sp. TaxID=1977262 RepID=UPI0035B1E421
MSGYGQFCAIARAHEVLGGRWTLLVVRELLMGSRRFNDIRRGIPRISRTMLSERLRELVEVGAVLRYASGRGPEYDLTEAGRDLMEPLIALGSWGQRWLPRKAQAEDIDLDPLLVDMQRRVNFAGLPKAPLVVRFEIDRQRPRFLLLKPGEAAACAENPGFPEGLVVRGRLAALIGWWRGDTDFAGAQRAGLKLEGARALVRAFPGWFQLYLLADIGPARGREGKK